MAETFAQRAYDHIREKLLSGTLAPGQRLVNRTLAREIGVSAIPVREAISRLASEGLVSQVSGAGAYVRQPDRREVTELYGLREALETYGVVEAARYITEEELHILQDICKAARKLSQELVHSRKPATAKNIARWLELERQFHSLVIEAARNRWLSKIVKDLRLLTQSFLPRGDDTSMIDATATEATCAGHEALVAALEARDGDQAQAIMSQHLRTGLKGFLGKSHNHAAVNHR